MARNLRSKIASSDKFYIHDVNPAVTEQFAEELGHHDITISSNVREIAENAVRSVSMGITPPMPDALLSSPMMNCFFSFLA